MNIKHEIKRYICELKELCGGTLKPGGLQVYSATATVETTRTERSLRVPETVDRTDREYSLQISVKTLRILINQSKQETPWLELKL